MASRPKPTQREEYTHLDAKFDLTDASEARFGLIFFLSTTPRVVAGECSMTSLDYIELNVGFGGVDDKIVLKLPSRRADLVSHTSVKNIMTSSIAYWRADLAQVFPSNFAAALEAVHRRRIGLLRAVWMCYLRHGPLAQCIRPDTPCELEQLSEDGMLFTLSPHSPDPANPADMARAEKLQALFDSFHFDHAVVLYGWPNDPDEPRYTSQVTGAPADRAYVVGFCEFDGYDAARGVLLFARLFRLPPHWGTNLLPYYRENQERLESLPYVVQARQHIAAVRYVGADTPIEWHVGIEETATALKTLLNEWAAIPVEQLRVVCTPFAGHIDKEVPCL